MGTTSRADFDEPILAEAEPVDDVRHPGSAYGLPDLRKPPALPARRHRRWGAMVLALTAFGCVGWMASADVNQSLQQGRPSAAASPTPDELAVAWIRTNLPSGARLLSDGPTPPSGYPAQYLADGPDFRDFDYLLTSDRALPGEGDPIGEVWRSSMPVAVFDGMQVRRILAPTDPTLQAREADRADRLLAGAALLSNPGIATSADAQGVLARGELDLRAGTFLAALAGQLEVRLDAIDVVAAEAAAGTPARSITVDTADPAQITRVVSGLSAAYRPDRVIPTADGATRLQWPLSSDPSRR